MNLPEKWEKGRVFYINKNEHKIMELFQEMVAKQDQLIDYLKEKEGTKKRSLKEMGIDNLEPIAEYGQCAWIEDKNIKKVAKILYDLIKEN